MAATDGRALRPVRPGEGCALFEVTRLSVARLACGHCSAAQVESWMGTRAGFL